MLTRSRIRAGGADAVLRPLAWFRFYEPEEQARAASILLDSWERETQAQYLARCARLEGL